ncbi:CyclinH/Ccl1 [Trinorchestia longiramus]|nr:CyclinH/Ccl1 [Trinorchestia longiramus]
MFGSSTQLQSWTFQNEQGLQELRKAANEDYVRKQVNSDPDSSEQLDFLSAEEELVIVRVYVKRLRDFCSQFRDPRDARIRMPIYVSTAATHYFLRFYLYNSVMDHHPKYVMHTCIYLACKIEEFYVTINDYVHNVPGSAKEKELTASTILNSELQTTQELQFHLIIHQPYRPLEGLFIDLKTRYKGLQDAEALRGAVELFLEKVHLTDAPLLFSPSQLSLAAVTTAASKLGQNLDSYVTDILFVDYPQRLPPLIDAVRKIKRFVKGAESGPDDALIAQLEERLNACLNCLNDPTTEQYRIKQARLEKDDEDFPLVSSTAAVENMDLLEGTHERLQEHEESVTTTSVEDGPRRSSRRLRSGDSAFARRVMDGGIIDDVDCILDD